MFNFHLQFLNSYLLKIYLNIKLRVKIFKKCILKYITFLFRY